MRSVRITPTGQFFRPQSSRKIAKLRKRERFGKLAGQQSIGLILPAEPNGLHQCKCGFLRGVRHMRPVCEKPVSGGNSRSEPPKNSYLVRFSCPKTVPSGSIAVRYPFSMRQISPARAAATSILSFRATSFSHRQPHLKPSTGVSASEFSHRRQPEA